jgi:uncharacterized protein (TIGR00266 family)
MALDYEINGKIFQTLKIKLDSKTKLFAESGGMLWMSNNVSMETEMKGGLMGGLGRMVSGESLFLVNYTCNSDGFVTFGNEFPGTIKAIELSEGQTIIADNDAFLCAEGSAKLSTHFVKKIGAALLGGEGIILVKIEGPGLAFVSLSGEITQYDLKNGETIKVDTGALAMMEPSVTYDIERIKGIKNMLFGGEGFFLSTLKGPGRVWLQSMPVRTLASKIASFLPRK